MADVFISYKREDQGLAEDVISRIKDAGYSVWWDRGLTARESWDDVIEHELRAAKAVLVLWTPRSVTSEWVRAEASEAKESGKLVHVKLESCGVPLAFRLRQVGDLSSWDGDARNPEWRRTMSWIAQLAGDKEPSKEARPTGFAIAKAPAASTQDASPHRAPDDAVVVGEHPQADELDATKARLRDAEADVARLRSLLKEQENAAAELETANAEIQRLESQIKDQADLEAELASAKAETQRLAPLAAELNAANTRLRSSLDEIEGIKLRLREAGDRERLLDASLRSTREQLQRATRLRPPLGESVAPNSGANAVGGVHGNVRPATSSVPAVDVNVPPVGSAKSVLVVRWFKQPGDRIKHDEPLVMIISVTGVTVEIRSPATGVLQSITLGAGRNALIGERLGVVSELR